ncbi:MAG: hypothetical protein DRK00_03795 [Thermoprotei archaeon]|nr:MAG: hypothetical protein DRK00_03795 [Thermoprotei archaeon]
MRYAAILILALAAAAALADRGALPLGPVDVYEPGQKAIIAWDGETEVIVLTTDLYLPEGAAVLEFMPLPSKPEVELGSIRAFYALSKYLGRLGGLEAAGYRSAIQVVLHERLGPHDITVLEVGDASELEEWVREYIRERGLPEPPRLSELSFLVSDYVERGYRYLAIDLVAPEGRRIYSVEPIIYRFRSSRLYYPVKISSLARGETIIQLVLLTGEPLVLEDLEDAGFTVIMEAKVPRSLIEEADGRLAIIDRDEYWVTVARFSGRIGPEARDLEAHTGFSLKRIAPKLAFTAPIVLAACAAALALWRRGAGGKGLPAPAMLLSIAGLAAAVPPAMFATSLASALIPASQALASGTYGASSILALTASYLLLRGRRGGLALGWAASALTTVSPLYCLALLVVKQADPSPLMLLHLAAGAMAFLLSIAALILMGLKWGAKPGSD